MKIVYIISNFIYSAFNLLVLIVLYVDRFGTGLPPGFLLKVLGKVADSVFSERNMIGNLIICIVCILFAVLTVIFLIKNLIQKQKVTPFVLSAISIISMIVFAVLINPFRIQHSIKWFYLFAMVIIIVQLIVSLINTIYSIRLEEI